MLGCLKYKTMRISETLAGHEWLGIWPTISVVLFFVIFLVIIFQVVRYDKSLVKKWESMPLETEQEFKETESSIS